MSDDPGRYTEEGDEQVLEMPFIVVTSRGGQYDDGAYCAGWELGVLDARLDAAQAFGLDPPFATIRRGNLPQAELLAMQHRMVCRDATPDDWDPEVAAEWALVAFTWMAPL